MNITSRNTRQPLWYQQAVFYEVNLRAFYDSNADGWGDLPGLTQKLDYLRDLGVDCLWLMPIYPSPRCDDGYDISDYCDIDPQFGTVDDFKHLLDEAHARGMRVITDLVMNHTSDQHAWFQAARADRNSPYRDYYVWSDTDHKYSDARIIFLDTEKSNWTYDPLAGQYFWHRFYSSQPDLNYDSPAVQQAMLDVAKFWLGLGIDGFRVDTAKHVELAAWQQLKDQASQALAAWKGAHPDKKLDNAPFWMTGESWGHGVMQSDYYRHGFDAMINFDYQEQAAKAVEVAC